MKLLSKRRVIPTTVKTIDSQLYVDALNGTAMQRQAENAVRTLLRLVGENPKREGLQDTPKRYVKALLEMTRGARTSKDQIKQLCKTFKDGAENVDEMVVLGNIPVHSLCEHHMLPFSGKAFVGYVPHGQVIGLSKIPRLVKLLAASLQVQERLTQQIANALWETLNPLGVGVVLTCNHQCMECRGVEVQDVPTTTSSLYGVMKTKPEARAEFLGFVRSAQA